MFRPIRRNSERGHRLLGDDFSQRYTRESVASVCSPEEMVQVGDMYIWLIQTSLFLNQFGKIRLPDWVQKAIKTAK